MLVQKQKGDVNNCWLGSNSGYLDTTWAEYVFFSVFHTEYLATIDFFTSMRLDWLYGFEKCKMDVSIDIKVSREWVKFQLWLNYYPSKGTESQLSSSKKHELHMLKGISRCSSKFWAQKINPFFIHLRVRLLNDSLTGGEVISVSLLTGALFLRSNFPLL